MRRLSLQGRLLAALIAAGIVPVVAFAALTFLLVGGAVSSRQADDLAAISRLAANQVVGAPLDGATAQRLAEPSARDATLFGPGGVFLASSDPDLGVPAPPAAVQPGSAPVVVTRDGLVTAYAAIPNGAGVVAISQPQAAAPALAVPLLATLAVAVVLAMAFGPVLSRTLVSPLTRMTATLDRLQAGDLSARLPVTGDDEVSRLAASHNRLADALAARNRSLALVSHAVAGLSPRDGAAALVATAEGAAAEAFGFTSVRVHLFGPDGPPPGATDADPAERVPGEAFEVTTPLAIGDDRVGVLVATQVPTREWGEADEDLLRIFGVQLAAAVRNAELFDAVEGLAELKAEFLRGVSHNLQTPLTSIRAFAAQLATETGDRRLGIIVEQSDRLSRLVAQLLTVSKLEAGTLRPEVDVFALAPLVQRVWESLGRGEHAFTLRDEASGWLAAADRDWVEQVVWALLDNALKYGGEGAIEVTVALDPEAPTLVTTVRDHGPGIAHEDHERVFERFTRLPAGSGDGSGLGLSVARGLAEAMGGRLETVPPGDEDGGAAFALRLPAERIEEG
jgi:signal transduction histidine kinase